MMGFFFFQAEDGIRDDLVTGVQTCALPISQADEQAAAFGVGNIADQPVAPLPMAVGEIVPAHCLSVAREAAGQVRGVRGHVSLLTPAGRRPGRPGSAPSIQRGSPDHWCWSERTD